MGSIAQALLGAKVELAHTPSPFDKAKLCTSYAKIIGQELIGTLLLAPYGFRTWKLHRSLPDPGMYRNASSGSDSSVFLLKDQRYGCSERNVADVYIPRRALQLQAESQDSRCPVVIFCHGGVWAAGAKWQFAPFAASLAERGIVTCVLQYSLYPQALAPQMVEEVADAVDWVAESCPHTSAGRVSLVGHSAGAQLCLMALLKLIDPARHLNGRKRRLPARYIGMAGAYDIGMHYAYEEGRGVAYLSTMARAMGGHEGFASQSPAVILDSIADSAGMPKGSSRADAGQMRKAGEDAMDSSIIGGSLQKGREQLDTKSLETPSSSSSQPLLSIDDLSRLPETFLMSSKSDVTVPWTQSVAVHNALRRCRAKSHHYVYDNLGHGDFVIDWQYGGTHAKQLSGLAEDLIKIILEEDETTS